MTLPDPEAVVARAREHDPEAPGSAPNDTGSTPNVVVAGPVDGEAVERTDDGYVGDTAGELGRLAAAVAVDADATIHYPDPDLTVDGPWLVLAPLSGYASTVATGIGRVEIDLDYDPATDPVLTHLDERVSVLLDAARPRHDHYPVADDDRGVFTTGMTTFALDSLSVDGGVTATFDVSTTPATTATDVEARFADVPGVERVAYKSVVGVERADPSTGLRSAVEAAHREVRGDCEYDWLSDPGVFAEIPCDEKVAFGTGAPGATEFGREQYETCVDLLEAVLSAPEVVA